MTQPIVNFDAHGRAATGIPPIDCPDWCIDPGHIAERHVEEQTCVSASYRDDVECSLSVAVGDLGACYSILGAWAYRGFGRVPVVQLYICGFNPHIDRSLEITAAEADKLGKHLIAAAELIGGAR